MLTDEQYQRLLQAWEMLRQADPQMARECRQHAYYARIPANKDIFVVGEKVNAIALLLSGSVRVY